MAAFAKSWRREKRLHHPNVARLSAVSHVRHSAMLALTDAERRLYRDSSLRASGAAAASTGFREARQSHRFTARPRGRERAAIKSIAFIRRAAIPNSLAASAHVDLLHAIGITGEPHFVAC